MTPVLRARSVGRRHPNGLGVEDVSLSVAEGEVVALLGVNGSGKSTLLRVLATASPASSGSAEWFGIGDRRSPAVRRRLGVMFDACAHFDGLTGAENALFFGCQYGLSTREARRRLPELLEWAGLGHAAGLRVAEYSLGMRRRLGLLEAFLPGPRLIVLDEPTLALDHLGWEDLAARLRSEAAAGAAVVVATNDLELVAAAAQRFLLLAGGRVVREAAVSAPVVESLGSLLGERPLAASA